MRPPKPMSESALSHWKTVYPIGTAIKFFPVRGRPEFEKAVITSEPWRLGHGEPVVKVSVRAGGVALWAIERAEPSNG